MRTIRFKHQEEALPAVPQPGMAGAVQHGDHSETLQALHVLSEVTADLVDEDDVEELLGRFLTTMIRLAGASAGVVRVVTEDGEHLRLVGARGLPPELVARERVVPLDCGLCGNAIRENRVGFDIDLNFCCERNSHDYFGHECQAMVVVPLQCQGRLLGTYNLFLPQPFELSEELTLLFPSIGEHLGMALENARLKRENLRIALTNERQMMAAEVHDSLAQTLAYMKMRVALLQDTMCEDRNGPACKYVADISTALDEAYSGLRQLLAQFRNRMDPMGLLPALDRLAGGFRDRTGIELEYVNRIVDLRLDVDQEVQVFYIVQEALANVARHSGATRARLLIEGDGDYYVATVEDNGKGGQGFFAIANRTGGFDEHPQLRDHFGLSIMRERAHKIGGRVEVANLPRGGFRVRLMFPAMPVRTSA